MSGPVFGIVANEPSSDLLGAALVAALRARWPEARFIGVAGPQMQALGCVSLHDCDRLAVMGLVEVLGALPQILRARRELARYFLAHPPDVFIGIDAPDFNLPLAQRLRRAGILTVHMVCPTVWAWRPGRVKILRRAVDLLLSLFPFEEDFLRLHQVNARWIGHPLADELPGSITRESARAALGIDPTVPVIALLPGSRLSEVQRLTAPFLDTARWCWQRQPALRFFLPLAAPRLHAPISALLHRLTPELPVTLLAGRSREAMAAADVVLTASGTATLEALLLGRPMVVGYRLNPVTWRLITWLKLVQVQHVAMANLLVGRELAPEFLQTRCRAELLGPALLALLEDGARRAAITSVYAAVRDHLRRDAAHQAARALAELIARRN